MLGEFFLDLKRVLGPGAIERVGRKVLENDCLGLAGQLAYFILLSLFPFLMFLVSLVVIVTSDPEAALGSLTETIDDFLLEDVVGILSAYIDRTLRNTTLSLLFIGILTTLWSGWAAAGALIKAANRAYELRETRPLWKLWSISLLMVMGFVLLIAALALVVFSPDAGGYLQRLTGLPDTLLVLWSTLRWVLAFLTVTLALAILYYLAPNADLPFRWITLGGFAATVLMLVSGLALRFYVANASHYDQIYGQLGAGIVLLIWLYVISLMVLIGAETNAVLTRMAEERKGVELVRSEGPAAEDAQRHER